MAQATRRTVKAYALHARYQGGDIIDYEAFMAWVSNLSRAARLIELGNELSAVVDRVVQTRDGIWILRFVSGNPAETPIVYDENTGEVLVEETRDRTWRAVPTRVAIDTTARIVAIESRRAGIGSVNLERYFGRLARQRGFGKVTLDVNPLPSNDFRRELESLERIREAEIVVRRPNVDWNDAEDVLSDLAGASAAHKASVTVNADRGESLNTKQGIVGVIIDHIKKPLSNVLNVKVTGTPPNGGERTLNLDHFQMEEVAEIGPNAPMQAEEEAVVEAQLDIINRGRGKLLQGRRDDGSN